MFSGLQIEIIIVDDDPVVAHQLKTYLHSEGLRAHYAADGQQLRQLLKVGGNTRLVFLDVNMPKEDGFTLASLLRAEYPELAIILLSSRDAVVDQIVGLEVGADDYIVKPYEPRLLLARVKALLRRLAVTKRQAAQSQDQFVLGAWTFMVPSRSLHHSDGRSQSLTRAEFQILYALCRHPSQVFSRERLGVAIGQHGASQRSVDVLVRRLRRKLHSISHANSCIQTVRGEGYRLDLPPLDAPPLSADRDDTE